MMAMSALAAHKLRSALTLVGVLVGVFSIIIVMTAVRALQSIMETELAQLGANTFEITKWPAMQVGGGPESWEKYWRRKNIEYSHLLQFRQKATLAKTVGAETWLWNSEVVSKYEKTNPNVGMLGATPEVFTSRNWNIDQGRGFIESDMESARYVCVLGSALSKKIFPHGSPLNEIIKFHGVKYLVIGVLAERGGLGGSDNDNFLVIPLTTGMNRYSWRRSLSIYVQAHDRASFDDTIEQARGIMRVMRKVPPGKPDDFEINTNDSVIRQFNSLTLALRIGVSVVSSIALVAAGIGIMNIMLVSVTERTREIGIRRAIGAKKRHIMTQFIMEAVSLCQVGGAAGVLLGVLGGNLVAMYLKVPPVIPVDWVIIGLVICSIVGIVFGTYPAYKAANLDPIESLRYE